MKFSTKQYKDDAETFIDIDSNEPDEEGALRQLVQNFARVMEEKLIAQYRKGRRGWDDPSWDRFGIEEMLRATAAKGDAVDTANYAAFLWNRGDEPEVDYDRRYTCVNCGEGTMSMREYERQLDTVDEPWRCPSCGEAPIKISETFGEYPEATAAALRAINQQSNFPQPEIMQSAHTTPIAFCPELPTAEGVLGHCPNLEEQAENIRKQIAGGE